MTAGQQLVLLLGALAVVLTLMRLRHRRPSRRQRVLEVFRRHPETRWYVTDLCRVAGFSGGSIYPELAWLERERLVLSDWEPVASTPAGPRRQYWLNPWMVRSAHNPDQEIGRI